MPCQVMPLPEVFSTHITRQTVYMATFFVTKMEEQKGYVRVCTGRNIFIPRYTLIDVEILPSF